MIARIFVALVCLVCSTMALAKSLEVDLRDKAAQFRYIIPMGSASNFESSELDLGFLYTTDDDVMGFIGFQVVDETGSGSPGLAAGVGLKAFAATLDSTNNDVVAATIGGQVLFRPPVYPRLGFLGQVYYAPDIVAFMDAEKLLYTTARVQYEVLPQAVIYLGYRKVRVDLENGTDQTLDKKGHIGLQLLF